MKYFVAVFCIFVFINFGKSQTYWGTNTTSILANEAIDVEVDESGNQYVTGYFSGITNFSSILPAISSAGNSDIYVAKYNSIGTLIWVNKFGGSFSDKPTDLSIDTSGNILVTGSYFGSALFGSTTLNSVSGSKDIFILKLDNAGNVIWAISQGGSGVENANGITCDNQNNVIITGQFKGNSSLAGQVVNSQNNPITSTPDFDFFVAKYNSAGLSQWVKIGQADLSDNAFAVDCDDLGNIFLSGQFSDTLVFANTTFNNTSNNVGFVTKLSPAGNLTWFNKLKAGGVEPFDLEVNHLGEVHLAGDFFGNMNYITSVGSTAISSTYPKKIFALKTNNNGEPIWHKTIGSNNDISAQSISVDDTNNLYITGYFKCNLSEFHDYNTAVFNSVGFQDIFLIKLANNGTLEYKKQMGSTKNDVSNAVAILANQTTTICGSFTNDLYIPAVNSFPTTYFTGFTDFELHNMFAQFVFLVGDQSPNSFLTNALHPNSPDYNYFLGSPTDSLFGEISPAFDTIEFCGDYILYYFPKTNSLVGPEYSYLWSNGSIHDTAVINTSGITTVQVSRLDGCVSGTSEVVTIAHIPPSFPNLTDNLGINVNTNAYPFTYNFCVPDSVGVSFSNLCPTCNISIGNPVLFTDTNLHYYNQSGIYFVSITDSFCTNTTYFSLDIDSLEIYDSIQPYLFFPQDENHDDTIILCNDQLIQIHVYDYFTNPTEIEDSFNLQPSTFMNLNANYGGLSSFIDNYSLYASTFGFSGWFVYDYHITVGYNNLCGMDTTNYYVTDSIYVKLNTISISASAELCPGSMEYIFVDTSLLYMTWSGPGIDWISSGNDTIEVSEGGIYEFDGQLIDTINGCSGNLHLEYNLAEKTPPLITQNPYDGIICNGDSVTFSLSNQYESYTWYNPDGFPISDSNVAYGSDAGFYYCTVTDSSGCELTTLVAEVIEFAPPTLSASPNLALCGGDSVTITLNYSGNPYIYWQNPLSGGFSDEIIVSTPGTYICLIDQCGELFFDTIEIYDGTFSINLSTNDTVLCYSEEAILTATPGFSDYNWNIFGNDSSEVTTGNAGNYFVTVTNQFGCETNSDTIQIFTVPNSFPPNISDTVLCLGADITLADNAGNTLNWYNENHIFLFDSTEFVLTNLQADTTILAAFDVSGCLPAFQTIEIEIAPLLLNANILGDTIICLNDTAKFSIDMAASYYLWSINNNPITTDSVLSFEAIASPQIVTVEISNNCYSTTLTQTLTSFPIQSFHLNEDSLLICPKLELTISPTTNFDSIVWTSNLGISYQNPFEVNSQIGDGYLFALGIDENGCPTISDSVWLETSNLNFSLTTSNYNCPGDSVEVMFNTSSSNILWQGNNFSTTENFIVFEITDSVLGWFPVMATDNLGCQVEDSIFLALASVPEMDLPADTILCLNDVLAHNQHSNAASYFWLGFPNDDFVTIGQTGWYTLIATNQDGCAFSDSIYVQAMNCTGNLPNVFTPNGDGSNDFYFIEEAPLFPNNEILVLNRWGNVVFQADSYKNNWNGENLLDGVYYVVFRQDKSDPNTKTYNGFVHIVR